VRSTQAVHDYGKSMRQGHDHLVIAQCLTIFIAQALSQDHLLVRVSMT
jgi:hypothetical protein